LRAGPLTGRRGPDQTNNQRKSETDMKRHFSLVASALLLAGFLAGCASEISWFFDDPPPLVMQTGESGDTIIDQEAGTEGSIMDQITPTSALDELNYYEDEDKMGGGDG
jgi:hypothetical protein